MIQYNYRTLDSTKRVLGPKVAAYKINIQKSVLFFYIHNKHAAKEIKKTISFTIASKRTKYLGVK
jgi:hypothetical protein